jgi:transcriptional regulator GlxA family with amidase domain
MSETFVIGIPVYPMVDLLDVAGPREVFFWMQALAPPETRYEVLVLAETRAAVPTHAGLPIVPDRTFDEFAASGGRLDLLWVPGAADVTLAPMLGGPFGDRIRALAEGASYVTSVCTGAILLADAGLLKGFEATTHWGDLKCLAAFEGVTVAKGHPRWVISERPGEATRVTGGGVSSGLDEALRVVELLAGTPLARQVQQMMQYYPKPPVKSRIPKPPPCDLPISS